MQLRAFCRIKVGKELEIFPVPIDSDATSVDSDIIPEAIENIGDFMKSDREKMVAVYFCQQGIWFSANNGCDVRLMQKTDAEIVGIGPIEGGKRLMLR